MDLLVTTTELTQSLNVTPQRIAALAKHLGAPREKTKATGRTRGYKPSAVKKILSHRGVNYKINEIMSFCNNKGGVGKTSLAINTAMRLYSLGFKVLLIDADPQANATSYLIRNKEYNLTLFDIISQDLTIDDVTIKINDNFHFIPSNLLVGNCDLHFATKNYNQQTYFKKMLENLGYNYVIWDLSPSLCQLNFLALLSCERINIVTNLSEFSVQGLEMQNDVIEKAKKISTNTNQILKC